ncbi:triple tyrosine motif-containing protein [Puia sp.]|uniref:triple tyrosine motif-containing protein n=1 Tax=Puia sp. TaxID=2045100 RepID=UPI002F3E335B
MRTLLVISSLLLSVCSVLAQNGVLIPEIINFSKKVYQSGNQNRGIEQDPRGLLYFANDDGLLVFDGTYWHTYALPNRSIVRSLVVDSNRIFVGGQQEIGYFYFDAKGVLTYQSLRQLIPPGETDFTDVWHVVRFRHDIFFQSNKRIFRFHDGKITAFRSINWSFLGACRDLLIAQEYDHGLMCFINGAWQPLATKDNFSKDKVAVRSLTGFGTDKIFLTTVKAGVFLIDKGTVTKWETPAIAAIIRDFIHYSCAIDTTLIAIATRLGGYYIINTRGEIVQHVTKLQGLQSNTINNVYADKEKNLWLALNNGIDLVIFNSPISHITPDNANKSPGYSAAVYHDRLYIGTGIGLYNVAIPPDYHLGKIAGSFIPVPNGNGIIWGLSVVNGQLLMGRNDGAYIVEKDSCVPLDLSTGFWSFQPLTSQQPCPRIIGGAYNGVNIYTYPGNKFVNPRLHTSFESAKNIVVKDSDIWVAHPYQGLYKISFNDTGAPVSKHYKDIHHILSSGHNHLFMIRGKIVLVTGNGIFEYDPVTRDFKPSAFFSALFGSLPISYLREDAQGNIWFIAEKKPGVIDMSSPGNPVMTWFPELNNLVLGNDEEFIYPINKDNVLLAGEVGFYHLDYDRYRTTSHRMKVLLRSITVTYKKDSVLFGGYLFDNGWNPADNYVFGKRIGHKWNSIHFEFSTPYFSTTVEYSCRLGGYEKEWTPWSKRTERTFTNLPAGDYVFECVARNSSGFTSAVSQFTFTISPPWYNSYLAWVVYVLAVIWGVYYFYKRQQKKYLVQHADRLRKQREKFGEEQRRLQYLHQLEIEKNEKEIIRLENIRLEAEAEHNEAQLASNTMNLLQKRELLNKIKDEIIKAQEEAEPDRRAKNIRRIIKIINDELEVADDWQRFSVYFDKANNDFLKTLKETFPLLTPTDLKLCAYLRLNLSTKAIADLLNLSTRGVESSRYRLRKKLDLAGEVSLADFLSSVGSKIKSNQS